MLHFKTHWFTISLAFLLKCFLSRVYFYFILKSLRSGSWILHPRERGLEISKRKILIRTEKRRGVEIRIRRVGKGKRELSLQDPCRDKNLNKKIFKSQNLCWKGKERGNLKRGIRRQGSKGRARGSRPHQVQLLSGRLERLFIASAAYEHPWEGGEKKGKKRKSFVHLCKTKH